MDDYRPLLLGDFGATVTASTWTWPETRVTWTRSDEDDVP